MYTQCSKKSIKPKEIKSCNLIPLNLFSNNMKSIFRVLPQEQYYHQNFTQLVSFFFLLMRVSKTQIQQKIPPPQLFWHISLQGSFLLIFQDNDIPTFESRTTSSLLNNIITTTQNLGSPHCASILEVHRLYTYEGYFHT